ncbi:hypothetical protein KPSA3_04850 [Pseudomonas syringae pv. actinidiae]|uniref:Uncharacterized protein n=1 Tax=Pseudomonas syringae pv. actinidiae TaxID=103796 RepID=A0AAN4TN48_PSESF|nr:hypothetical protein KPSA3_04850 [Pseudomonas syringae pv. actinidiae]
MRRSASHAVRDALRPLLRRRASRPAFPRWSVGNDNLNYLNYRATLCVACRSGRSASSFTTQSVATCIPTRSVGNDKSLSSTGV